MHKKQNQKVAVKYQRSLLGAGFNTFSVSSSKNPESCDMLQVPVCVCVLCCVVSRGRSADVYTRFDSSGGGGQTKERFMNCSNINQDSKV